MYLKKTLCYHSIDLQSSFALQYKSYACVERLSWMSKNLAFTMKREALYRRVIHEAKLGGDTAKLDIRRSTRFGRHQRGLC